MFEVYEVIWLATGGAKYRHVAFRDSIEEAWSFADDLNNQHHNSQFEARPKP